MLKKLSPNGFEIYYAGAAVPILFLAILTPLMIIEPPDVIKKKQRRSSAKRFKRLSKFARLRKSISIYFVTIYKAFKLKPKLLVAVLIFPYMVMSLIIT